MFTDKNNFLKWCLRIRMTFEWLPRSWPLSSADAIATQIWKSVSISETKRKDFKLISQLFQNFQ